MSFFDFDGSPNKTSNSTFDFAFGGDSQVSDDRNLNRSAFDFDWDHDANNTNDFGFNAEEPSPKKARKTPLKTNYVNSNHDNGHTYKSKKESPRAKTTNPAALQGKVSSQGMIKAKASRESPAVASKAISQKVNEADGNFKKPCELTSSRNNHESQISNKNLQSDTNGKHKDDTGLETVNLENEDGGKVPNKNPAAESDKSSNGENKNDKLSLDEVLKNSLGRLHAKIASVGPELKRQEEAEEIILDKASHLMSEIVQYRESLEETKHNFYSRLTQVASFLSQERK